jgi:predicted metal-dependent phosphoesterase TrpH
MDRRGGFSMGHADLHVHTIHSDGASSVTDVLQAASRAHLDVIAITDHDNPRAGLWGAELAPSYGLEVIPGCEVTTAHGHLLALDIHQPVSRDLSLAETVQAIAEQGGFCVIPHPGARWVDSLQEEVIAAVAADPLLRHVVLGIEVYNASLLDRESLSRAHEIARRTDLVPVATSDAHVAWNVGAGAIAFAGHTAQDLRASLEQRRTSIMQRERPGVLRLWSSWVRQRAAYALGGLASRA